MRKKIAIIYDFLSERGGVERVIKFQVETLLRAGHDVSVGSAFMDKKNAREMLPKGVKLFEYASFVHRNETLQIVSSMIRESSLEKLKDYDLIICHSFPASYLALRLKKKYGVPYVLTFHHPPQFLYRQQLAWALNTPKRFVAFMGGLVLGPAFRALDRRCVAYADGAISVSKVVQSLLKSIYHKESSIVYPAIDSVFRRKKKDKKTRTIIFGSGRIIKQKRFDYLIEAASLLPNKRGIDVVLAGKDNPVEKARLTRLAQARGVNLTFTGSLSIDKLRQQYENADVTVLTCPKEWFGLVPIEAFACGCPVVSWKDGFGPEETIIEGTNGFLARPYSVVDLSKKIDMALKKKWGPATIEATSRKYTEKSLSPMFLNAIKKFLN